ncbi:MAG: 2Fe-2S iron-sulfur cluster-binding protein [Gammaproteobacteria bacterium]
MARLVTLSRAARLVGVKRATLQKRIQDGDLSTFEGQLYLSELLRAYPQAKVEDSGMLDRAEQMIERAMGRAMRDTDSLPDAEVLATRVAALSHELGEATYKMRRYDTALQQLQDYLRKLAEREPVPTRDDIGVLRAWLETTQESIAQPIDDEGEFYATDMLLRVMAAQVRINPSGHEFLVQGTDTVLDSGLRAGLALDYGCSDGSCGRCKARVVSGTAKPVRRGSFRLSDAEREQGCLLMCAHTAVTDLVLEAPEIEDPTKIGFQRLQATVRGMEQAGDDLMLLSLRPNEQTRLCFLAGQSALLRLDDKTEGSYPIASCPCDEGQLEFHIRRRPDDAWAEAVFSLVGLGKALTLEGPRGDFVLAGDSMRAVIFIAWDNGFAPIKSLIEHAIARDVAETLQLYWITTTPGQPYMHNRCRAWQDAIENFQYTHLSFPPKALSDETHMNEQINALLTRISEAQDELSLFDIYIAAPAAVGAQCLRYFTARGVPDAQVHISSDGC